MSDLPELDLVGDHLADGYDSSFEPKERSSRRDDVAAPEPSRQAKPSVLPPSREVFREEFDRNERIRHMRNVISGMTAHERHQKFLRDYVLFYGDGERYLRDRQQTRRNDFDVIAHENRFVWQAADRDDMTWEKTLAKKYHDKLFKEYCLADLSQYRTGAAGLRWRTEKEVFEGTGQFSCGNIACHRREELTSWEVTFKYMEREEMRKALVKLRLCPKCSKKLHYKSRHDRKQHEQEPSSSLKVSDSAGDNMSAPRRRDRTEVTDSFLVQDTLL